MSKSTNLHYAHVCEKWEITMIIDNDKNALTSIISRNIVSSFDR